MSSILYLHELEQALRFWEDTNFIAEVRFQLNLHEKSFPENEKPEIGSDCNDTGFLRRGIKNFDSFRSAIQNRSEISDEQFLPRVPTARRNEASQLEMIRKISDRTVVSFPYFLTRWNKVRKVFNLSSSQVVTPIILDADSNYLRLLPHEAFIVKFAEPMITLKEFDGNGQILLIILANEGFIEIFGIPEWIDEPLLSPELREIFKRGLHSRKVDRKILGNLGSGSKLIADINFFTLVVELSEDNQIGLWGYKPPSKQGEIENIEERHRLPKEVMNWLNGFCKMISELEPRQKIILADDSIPTETHNSDSPEWNAVPVSEVRNLDEEMRSRVVFVGHGSGSEKSPHKRRGHYRRLKGSDGKIKHKIWIPEITVRKDKLETENLKGSATVLKKE